MLTDDNDSLLLADDQLLKTSQEAARVWLAEIDGARRRERKYRGEAKKLVQMYEGEREEQTPFNILFSNTETLAPAVYNSTPRPIVERRFKDESPIALAASQVVKRLLEFSIDSGQHEGSTFDDLMKSGVIEALVPGRGVARFEYFATMTQQAPPELGLPPVETVTEEGVRLKKVPWDRFLHGYAKKWEDVPWVAFEHFMTREELVAQFGAEIGPRIGVEAPEKEKDEEGARGSGDELEDIQVAPVYQIWDKDTRSVVFVSPNHTDGILSTIPDPLGLAGFFPCPEPMHFITKISTLVPVPPYRLYKRQAEELNRVSTRINKLIDAMKVRGMYDSTVEGIAKVLEADDNTLIAADNVAALLAQGNALEKAIWLFPIEKLIPVLQQLYVQRNQSKQVIYEITGIADIMRGSSAASETLGAQEIKNQWGTLRLKRAQKEVARYARDCLRIMAEIAVSKFSLETVRKMTGLPFPTAMEQQQAQALVQQAMQQAQMTGQPPPAPPPQLLAVLQQPSWESLLQLLQDDLTRAYSIDIETNSTVDAEATEDKQDVAELLNALSQFLNGVGPLIEQGVLPFEVMKGVMLTIVRRFRFGPELESQLNKMQAPPPAPPDPKVAADAAKAQAELQKMQMEAQAKQQEMAFEAQRMEREAQLEAARMQLEMQKAQMEATFAQQEHAMKMQELARLALVAAAQHEQKMQLARQKPARETSRH